MGVVMYVPSGRGAVARVEAVERARAERRELVDLLLLACALLWSRCALRGRERLCPRRVGAAVIARLAETEGRF